MKTESPCFITMLAMSAVGNFVYLTSQGPSRLRGAHPFTYVAAKTRPNPLHSTTDFKIFTYGTSLHWLPVESGCTGLTGNRLSFFAFLVVVMKHPTDMNIHQCNMFKVYRGFQRI